MRRLWWGPVVWVLLHMVLLLSVFSPLAIITFALLMIPIVVLFVQWSVPKFSLFFGIELILLVGLFQSFGLIAALIALFFLPTALVIGTMYKKRASARKVLISGTLTMLAQLLLTLLIATLSGFNITTELRQVVTESVALLPESVKSYVNEEALDQVIRLMIQMLPLYFICFSGLCVAVTHALARRILNRGGAEIEGLKPVREWMLPKSLVWYFMVALLLDFLIRPSTDNMVTMILQNLIPLLTLAFSIQAIAFLFYVAHVNRWNRALPIAGIIAMIVFPFIQYLFSVLGVLDVAFSLRQKISGKK